MEYKSYPVLAKKHSVAYTASGMRKYLKPLRFKIVALTILSIVVCAGIGFAVDALLGTKPMGLIIGIVISVFVAQALIWRFVKKYLQQHPVSAEDLKTEKE